MDDHATTPVDPRVLEAMLPYFTEEFGNAASVDHLHGHTAQQAVEHARASVAKNIGASDPEAIIFTSGATESDNIAVIGTAEAYASKGNHVIVSAIEHKAVLDSAKYLEGRGIEVTVLPVDRYGMVDPDDVAHAITDRTLLVSVMFANNEIGTIEPVAEIGRITRDRGVLFHTDAAQAVGHVPVDVEAMNIDLLSISGHKMYGPKGIGVLYARRRRPRAKPSAVIHGGGHERGMRSGTLNVPGIVGLAKALELAVAELETEVPRLRDLTDSMLRRIQDDFPGAERNGHPHDRLPGNLNVYMPGVESRALVLELNELVSFSTGSACTTAVVEPSHVILALGFGEQRAHESVRFGLGRFTENSDASVVAGHVAGAGVRLAGLAGFVGASSLGSS